MLVIVCFMLSGSVTTKAKFHITVGHETVMGHIFLFGLPSSASPSPASNTEDLDFSLEYTYQEDLYTDSVLSGKTSESNSAQAASSENDVSGAPVKQFVLVELEKPVTCSRHALMIGSKLDTDIHANMCRLAFHGRIIELLEDVKYRETVLPKLKVGSLCMCVFA